jgi:hypothetical protein
MQQLKNDDQTTVKTTRCCHRPWQPMGPLVNEVDCQKKMKCGTLNVFQMKYV